MKIVIYERTAQNRSEVEFIRDKLAPGLAVSGDDVEISDAKYVDCDVAVIMWSPRNGQPDRARAARAIRNLHGKNLLIVETPIIRSVKAWHFRVGFDHAHRGGRFRSADMPDDRATAMGLKLEPWKTEAGPIVIAGQLPNDFSLDGLDINEWVLDVASHVQRMSRYPVIIRPHPLDLSPDWIFAGSSLGVEVSRETVQHDLARAGTWIAYTSGSAVDAVMAGVPTICMSEANFAREVSSHSLKYLDKPWTGDRAQWLANLAYAQWTRDEIGDGLCWRSIRTLVESESVTANPLMPRRALEQDLPRDRPGRRAVRYPPACESRR